jgi:hypothetical protein
MTRCRATAGGAADNRAIQNITAIEALVVHSILPGLPPDCVHQFSGVRKRQHTVAAFKAWYGSDQRSGNTVVTTS